jgi:hypothetical protein
MKNLTLVQARHMHNQALTVEALTGTAKIHNIISRASTDASTLSEESTFCLVILSMLMPNDRTSNGIRRKLPYSEETYSYLQKHLCTSRAKNIKALIHALKKVN